jgi:hypothetical protein
MTGWEERIVQDRQGFPFPARDPSQGEEIKMIREMFASKGPRKLALDAGLLLDPPDSDDARGEDASFTLVSEEIFRKVLSIERKRNERSRRRFVLMLVHTGKDLQAEGGEIILEGITKALSASTRETDLGGWYKNGSVVGVICTEIGTDDLNSILRALHSKVGAAFRNRLEPEQMKVIHISFHVFPDDLELKNDGRSADIRPYPDLVPV